MFRVYFDPVFRNDMILFNPFTEFRNNLEEFDYSVYLSIILLKK